MCDNVLYHAPVSVAGDGFSDQVIVASLGLRAAQPQAAEDRCTLGSTSQRRICSPDRADFQGTEC